MQARAAAEAGASVVQIPVGTVRDFYRSHPGVIRDPYGPREDSGFMSPTDPAIELVKRCYSYIKCKHQKTR